jgi:hypothetical protein
MTNTYKALTSVAEVWYQPGVFEADLTATEEQDAVNSGLLEIVPRTYRVLSNNYAAGKQNESVELALLVEHEQALISGGHIERVDKPAAKAAEKKEK